MPKKSGPKASSSKTTTPHDSTRRNGSMLGWQRIGLFSNCQQPRSRTAPVKTIARFYSSFGLCVLMLLASTSTYAQIWSSTGSLGVARFLHTATLLPSGKVLVVGGIGNSSNNASLSSAELFDPASGTWSSAASLHEARNEHTATLLSSGDVLVAGGSGEPGALTSVEIYHPASNTWSYAASLNFSRGNHDAVLLRSGKLLVIGGSNAGSPTSTEIYDPVSNSWTVAAPMASVGRAYQSTTLLQSGKVLVAGGQNNTSLTSSVEIYDPVTNTWTSAPSLASARSFHTATLLPSGDVLIAGGADAAGAGVPGIEIYNPATNSWTKGPNLYYPRFHHTATLLPEGIVLISGGCCTGSVNFSERYDPASNTLKIGGYLNFPRYYQTTTLLSSGLALTAGGFENLPPLTSAEIYGDTVSELIARFVFVLVKADEFSGSWTDFSFGLPDDIPLVMQVNGGEIAKPGVYRPSTGYWYINLPGAQDYDPTTTKVVQFGGFPGDIPQVVNIDGIDHIAINRSGQLIVDTNNESYDATNVMFVAGGSRPIPATISEIVSNGLYFDGGWNSFDFGLPGDVPLLAQLEVGGLKLPVVFRPSTATWYINLNGYGSYTASGTQTVLFGLPGDIPRVVYWNGADHIAVFRPGTGKTIVDTNNESYNGSNQLIL